LPATVLDAHFPGGSSELVLKHDDLAGGELEKFALPCTARPDSFMNASA